MAAIKKKETLHNHTATAESFVIAVFLYRRLLNMRFCSSRDDGVSLTRHIKRLTHCT